VEVVAAPPAAGQAPAQPDELNAGLSFRSGAATFKEYAILRFKIVKHIKLHAMLKAGEQLVKARCRQLLRRCASAMVDVYSADARKGR